jgi:hypothetical protein
MLTFLRTTVLVTAVFWLIPETPTQGEIPRLCAEKRRFCLPAGQTVWVCPQGPDNIPCCLEGVWKVSLCIESYLGKCGHTWMRFENTETGEVHTTARYIKGYGGVRDIDTGCWMYRPAKVSGVQWDLDMKREHLIGSRRAHIVTTLVENPRIFRGRNNGYGHGRTVNNCVTYTRDAWHYYTGEYYKLPPLLHTADTLLRRISKCHPEINCVCN